MEHTAKFEAAQSEEGRYRMLVEAVTDYAIYMLDPRGIVSSWNPGARRFKDYEPAEIIGRHFSNFYTDEDKANLSRNSTKNRYEESKAFAPASACHAKPCHANTTRDLDRLGETAMQAFAKAGIKNDRL